MHHSDISQKAILHIDVDSFFASCEQAVDRRLKGRPVVTGKERGICSAASYEAKALGVKRGMPLHEIRRICPKCVILPSNYETYSIFSTRLFGVVRRYTSEVEEYSIDECFADITGLRRSLKMSYPKIAEAIKKDIEQELNITVSVGLAPTKVLAKIGSKWDKPSGLVIVNVRAIRDFLRQLSPSDIWGIGIQTESFLKKFGVKTAGDFLNKSEQWVNRNMSKSYREIWRELGGTSVYDVDTHKKEAYKSISKTKTFTPPSKDRSFLLAQLSKNIENACIKARRHGLTTNKVIVYLKTQSFQHYGLELKLRQRVSIPEEIMRVVDERFDDFFQDGALYRATGVVLLDLGSGGIQQDIFGAHITVDRFKKIHQSVDELSKRYGKHAVFLGSSFQAIVHTAHEGDRKDVPVRYKRLLKGETERKRLCFPVIGETK